MRIVYFAKVRETIGLDEEMRLLPDTARTIEECLDWLQVQDSIYQSAFSDRAKLRFALDQKVAKIDAALEGIEELAIFPPVTGG
jgi:sulfur-carrier protein